MIERYLILALIAGAVVFAVCFVHPGAALVIKIRRGAIKVARGKPKRGFIEDCERIVRDSDMRRGTIIGIRRGQTMFLKFSRNIPKRHHQRFRNAWHASK